MFSNNITVMLLLLIKALNDMTKFFLFDELRKSNLFQLVNNLQKFFAFGGFSES